MIDFTIPPALDDLRTCVANFVREDILPAEKRMPEGRLDEHVLATLRQRARDLALWTPHLPPEWGGIGVGPLGMALISQELGVSAIAPLVLNCSAPDEGNMHLLEKAATHEQKQRYLRPLAAAEVRSCFAMTEQASGADAAGLKTQAVREGDEWVLTGEKWFITGANGAAFAIVVAVSNPNVPPQQGMTLFLVDADTPGWEVVREIPVMGTHGPGGHCEVRLNSVRVPHSQILGQEGQGFALAQLRLGPARLAHCMRWIGVAQRSLDIATARARTRETFGAPLAERQAVQWMLADSAMDLYASRLMVLHSAWLIEHEKPYRQEVAMAKVYVAEALGRIVDRALQICGSLGYSGDLPIERFYRDARAARIYDGPSEVHRMVIARNLLKASALEGDTKSACGGLA
ncbi:MAG: Acyl-CoA dehydrogenase [Ktedonobacterales bacterium]|jgi:alkylation response protein AidB-like acyl-CoA dehydrogenase|nr:MAG: Acyl-CoA dehydrogenase [Ktedonobacterales bacterium]